MPPTISTLPSRSGAFHYSDEDVSATIELLGEITSGQVVALGDPEPTENKARRKCQVMREQIEATGRIDPGYKIRGHVISSGEPNARGVHPENVPAVSLVPKDSVDEPADASEPTPEPTPDATAENPARATTTDDNRPADTGSTRRGK